MNLDETNRVLEELTLLLRDERAAIRALDTKLLTELQAKKDPLVEQLRSSPILGGTNPSSVAEDPSSVGASRLTTKRARTLLAEAHANGMLLAYASESIAELLGIQTPRKDSVYDHRAKTRAAFQSVARKEA